MTLLVLLAKRTSIKKLLNGPKSSSLPSPSVPTEAGMRPGGTKILHFTLSNSHLLDPLPGTAYKAPAHAKPVTRPESESEPRSVSPHGDSPATSTDFDTSTFMLHLHQEPSQSLQAKPGCQVLNSTPEQSGLTLKDPTSGSAPTNMELLTYLQSISTPHFNLAIRPYSLEQLYFDRRRLR